LEIAGSLFKTSLALSEGRLEDEVVSVWFLALEARVAR
jgi:hypothetical protein